MSDVLVSENITGDALDRLQREFDVAVEPMVWQDTERLDALVQNCRALIVRNQTRVTAELIAKARSLQIIARAGAGLDNVDVQAATDAGIVVSYAPHENSTSVAELTIGLMLALARKIPAAHHHTSGGGWNRSTYTGVELSGKTLGVVGLGRIGSMVAQRAKAMQMSIVAHDDYIDPLSDRVRELQPTLVSLDELLEQADFVSCHTPLTDETRGLFNDARFGRMKRTAYFINTSRGEAVEEEALARALEEGRIAGAALDVRCVEPPDASSLNQFENVILTPHIAAFTREAQQRVVATVCRDVAAVLAGEEAGDFANFPAPRGNA